ncbi:MAG TPA: site-2 protease family protein [Acidimicrobiales bacterium]|nr:site-2 protease family protein [Acidimicrobiales bacterium]
MSSVDLRPSGAPGVPPPPDEDSAGGKSAVRSLVELVVVVGAVVALAVAAGQVALLIVVASLIVMIMVHELGHFLAAKRGHMKVTEYFLGFGPRLWSFRKGETEYGVKAIPLGGYVKIPGMTNLEEVDPADEARTYREQPFHARLLVAVAGSAMHFVMAFVLLWTLVTFVGLPNGDKVAVRHVVDVAGRPGPAQVAGLRPGDVVVSVDGRSVGGNGDVLVAALHGSPDRPVTLVVDRAGTERTLVVTPVDGRTVHQAGVTQPPGSAPYGLIGVSLDSPVERVGPLAGLARTGSDIARFSWASVVGVAHLFTPSATVQRFGQLTDAKAASQASANGTRVQSVVGVVQTATDAVHAGIGDLLIVLVSINLFVGIFNLFPMLPLDGGHVAIAVYEKIRSTRSRVRYHADVAKLLPYTWALVAFLGILFTTSLVTDLLHPQANPFG